MEDYLPSLALCPLFEGIAPSDLSALLRCLGVMEARYEKGAAVLLRDELPRYFGIALSGGLFVEQDSFWGNRHIMERIEPVGLFGAAFSLGGFEKLPVSITAAEPTTVLLIDGRKISKTCTAACTFHARLIRNLLSHLAQKNVLLIQKLEHLTQRSIREKLLSYLSSQALGAKAQSFAIPFNRQELADYLCVDRSALCSELGRMRDDGLLTFAKSRFTLNKSAMERNDSR
ncbi:Crp/Fnr family transcriptional regulator [Breznakiellaceae bacterium SP9]